jgi:hypothetical protein
LFVFQDQQERQWSVLWMIEVHRSSQFSKQVVKILSTTTSNSAHEKQKIKTQMSKLLTERSDGYLERCRLDLNVETHQAKTWSKAYDKEVNFQWKRPKFSPVAVMAESTIDDVSADVSDHLANNLSLMKFFKLTSTYTRLLTNPLESNYESPFVLGPEEEDMVDSSVSQIILGRSGTGKTTVQLNRVFRLEVSAFELFSESSSDRAADELSMQHLSQDIMSRLQNGGKLHQIMFTQSEQLCRTFNSVFKRMLKAANLSTHAYFGGQNDQSSLAHDNLQGLDFNDEVEQSIPNDFRQLTDHHFPLFVTAKKLMLMFGSFVFVVDAQIFLIKSIVLQMVQPIARFSCTMTTKMPSRSRFFCQIPRRSPTELLALTTLTKWLTFSILIDFYGLDSTRVTKRM